MLTLIGCGPSESGQEEVQAPTEPVSHDTSDVFKGAKIDLLFPAFTDGAFHID